MNKIENHEIKPKSYTMLNSLMNPVDGITILTTQNEHFFPLFIHNIFFFFYFFDLFLFSSLYEFFRGCPSDYNPQVIEEKEQSQPSCLPLSYVLRFLTDAERDDDNLFNNSNSSDIKRKIVIKHHSYSLSSSNRSSTPTGWWFFFHIKKQFLKLFIHFFLFTFQMIQF